MTLSKLGFNPDEAGLAAGIGLSSIGEKVFSVFIGTQIRQQNICASHPSESVFSQ